MNPFKNSSNQHLLKALFYESDSADKTGVIYTLKDDDYMGYPSLHRLYIECEDSTEYLFTLEHLDGWAHWEKLLRCDWFVPYVTRWRTELELKIKAKALRNIKDLSSNPGPAQFSANKYLVDGGWNKRDKTSAGRPTKDAIKKEAENMFNLAKHEEEIFNNMTRN